MTTKIIDKKGRLMLGAALARRMVIVDDSDPEKIVISPPLGSKSPVQVEGRIAHRRHS
jgi:hypothetical protein